MKYFNVIGLVMLFSACDDRSYTTEEFEMFMRETRVPASVVILLQNPPVCINSKCVDDLVNRSESGEIILNAVKYNELSTEDKKELLESFIPLK